MTTVMVMMMMMLAVIVILGQSNKCTAAVAISIKYQMECSTLYNGNQRGAHTHSGCAKPKY
ncbi:hypothetical protein TYRP_002109 [Tyrophagus putrescentiae]|nr:hypothetical protein TYRP_002109 [Tyrophagus putrescentiae]